MKEGSSAYKITCDNRIIPIVIGDIQHLYRELRCTWFDVVRMDDETDMFVDDEGLLRNAPVNMLATALLIEKTGLKYTIFGDVIVLGNDKNGETIDAPNWVGEWVADMEKRLNFKETIK